MPRRDDGLKQVWPSPFPSPPPFGFRRAARHENHTNRHESEAGTGDWGLGSSALCLVLGAGGILCALSAPPLWLINYVFAAKRHRETHRRDDGEGTPCMTFFAFYNAATNPVAFSCCFVSGEARFRVPLDCRDPKGCFAVVRSGEGRCQLSVNARQQKSPYDLQPRANCRETSDERRSAIQRAFVFRAKRRATTAPSERVRDSGRCMSCGLDRSRSSSTPYARAACGRPSRSRPTPSSR